MKAGLREVGQAGHALAVAHRGLQQRFAVRGFAGQRNHVAGNGFISMIAPIDLLAAWPRRLAFTSLPTRTPGVFLELVGTIERRRVGRRGQAGADAETVDRRACAAHRQQAMFVETATDKDVD